MADYSKRRDTLLRTLKKRKLPGMLVTDEMNVTYLTGFTGDSTVLLLTPDRALLISDPRYTTQIEEECPDVEAVIRSTSSVPMKTAVADAVKSSKLNAIAFEADHLTTATHADYSAALEGVELLPTSGIVVDQRAVKDADEIAEIRVAVDLAERSFRAVTAALHGEMTEAQAAAEMEYRIRMLGGRGFAFDPIVGVGPRSALPHGRAGQTRFSESTFCLFDWGARKTLYRSDITRMVIYGKLPAKIEKIYGVVLEAQRLAIEKIGPGVSTREVDSVARKHIADAGYEKRFGHGLGHGIGIAIHEQPRFSALADSTLAPGMVVTVEPGIYLPGIGGVRIEDDVLVTAKGAEVLTSLPRDLDACVVSL